MTALNARQRQALKMIGHAYVTRYVQRSVPSLAGRGLVVVEKVNGRPTGRVHLTDAGAAALAAIRAEDQKSS